jgi:formamidopyrimidine-DNA glycosylase
MPELPEVETTLRGIKPHIIHQMITHVIVRQFQLRWPIPLHLPSILQAQCFHDVQRRGKYILFKADKGTLLLHLGMSGRLRLLTHPIPPLKHDHVDIYFQNGSLLRFNDARRFGALLWTSDNIEDHPLLASMGPEPLLPAFDGMYLWNKARGKKTAVKSFIMDSHIVAGIGNIYATEALFLSFIKPQTPAGNISLEKYQLLAKAIKTILKKALKKGGTTLKDFMQSNGAPGYFSMELQAYGRGGSPCIRCHAILKSIRIGQRTTVYCPQCQH